MSKRFINNIESKGDIRDLIDIIIFVSNLEVFQHLFFKDEIIFSTCSELTDGR